MSLTNFVERADVRERLNRVLPVYERTLRVPILVPRARAADPWLVGTAFDYAFRFELQRRNPAAEHGIWMAEAALARLPRAMRAEGLAIVTNARRYVGRYARLRSPSDRQRQTLSRHAVRLARLDVVYRVYRAGLLAEVFDPPQPEDVAEVARLLAVIPRGIGRKARVILNPGFAPFSGLVGGADADAFIDSTLLDVKTWSPAVIEIEKRTMRQLVGYLILSRAARRAGRDVPDCERLALYFSRHGYLWELPTKPILNHSAWPALERWFLSTAAADARRRATRWGPATEPAAHAGPRPR